MDNETECDKHNLQQCINLMQEDGFKKKYQLYNKRLVKEMIERNSKCKKKP